MSENAIDREAHKPAVQEIVIDLLNQLLLAADIVKHLEKLRSDEAFRRNGLPANITITAEEPVQSLHRLIQQHYDWP